MKLGERDELIRYRMEQAGRTLHQAELLGEAAQWDGVVNRAYYAMFYAALALLLTKGMGSSKHAGVLALVDREFVRPGHLPAEMAMKLRDAFNQRQKSDYSELKPTSRARAQEILGNAREFVEAVRIVLPGLEDPAQK